MHLHDAEGNNTVWSSHLNFSSLAPGGSFRFTSTWNTRALKVKSRCVKIFPLAREYKLETPLGKEEVTKLRAGDILYVSGEVFTSRDRTQKLILENRNRLPFSLQGLIEFHAGPIVRRKNSEWKIVSIGPTTSFRMEDNEYEFIRETGVVGIIGKGGMGSRTMEACREFKAFYGVLPGGAAALIAKSVKRIIGVYWLEELRAPEAMWHLEVKELGPITIVIDAFGNDLYEDLRRRVGENLSRVLKSLEE